MWVSVKPSKTKGNSEKLTAVNEASRDSRLLECKSFALSAIIHCVFVVNLQAYGPAFEDAATNPITLPEREREGTGTARQKERERPIKGTREHSLVADDGKLCNDDFS